MIHELLINDERVDLGDRPRITMEYASNLLDEPGKLNLSHSYTIHIPRTIRNARILQAPERPANGQGLVRRYLSARYYRNGIDLLGPARAYVIKSTKAQYDIAIVSESLANLQALIESKDTLNDLPVPMLQWIGSSGKGPDYYSADFGFAKYQSGLPADPFLLYYTASHPYARVVPLLRMILQKAGVPFAFDETEVIDDDMYDTVILAAPSRKPNKGMETESGIIANNAIALNGLSWLSLAHYTQGWDAPRAWHQLGEEEIIDGFYTALRKFRIALNLAAPIGQDWSNMYLELYSSSSNGYSFESTQKRWPFVADDAGVFHVSIDEDLTPESTWNLLTLRFKTLKDGAYEGTTITAAPIPYDLQKPMMTVNFIHDHIEIAYDNRFPLQGNLPDISQWDFIRSVCAIFGLRLTVKDGALRFSDVQTWYDRSKAADWSGRLVDGTGETSDVSYSISSWARSNYIRYKEDGKRQTVLPFNPDAALKVDDQTLKDSRDYYKLPFAASTRDVAIHYKIEGDEAKNIDIAPRIFRLGYVNDVLTLTSPEEMYGQPLIERYYPTIQKAVENPVIVSTEVRLSEIDIKTLDLTVPVYLSQYGRYYAVLKVQTSDSDICKVELLQLP